MATEPQHEYSTNVDGSLSIKIDAFEKVSKYCSKSTRQAKREPLVKCIGIVIDSDPESGLVAILTMDDLMTCIHSSPSFEKEFSRKGTSLSDKINLVAKAKDDGEAVVLDENAIKVFHLGQTGLSLEIHSVVFFVICSDDFYAPREGDAAEIPMKIVGIDYVAESYKTTPWLYKLISCLYIQ